MKINSSFDLGFGKQEFKFNFEYEPMRVDRYLFKLIGEVPCEWLVDISGPPQLNINHTDIRVDSFVNNYYPTDYQWLDMDVKFISSIGPTSENELYGWFRSYAESATNRIAYASDFKKDVEISKIDPTGVVIDKYIINGAYPSTMDFGELSFVGETIEISCTLRMDRARIEY